ncbi:hypothetical protein GFL09_05555 [Pseudomonas stutzeri]|jgi:hypothetical protein|uniref:hypothetical protein n=1 Tax=Stutzerimonas TaxID=2901164 RepID=UPI0015E392C9|nr:MULTISPECIES: hypothetical protein [Stutzerimonas]MBA1264532.1 hypothetical protein [Stutzerimonas stutzeri]MBK3867160.1 hypothetical protein [Stutzerimonas stutzeri]
MKSISGLFLALALTATSPLIMAAGDDAQTMKHDHTVGDGHEVMLNLLKTGKVLRVTPATETKLNTGDVRTYEIIIKTPDGVTHSVEFRGMPVGIRNG